MLADIFGEFEFAGKKFRGVWKRLVIKIFT
jgi:hypothetical protein